MKYLYHMAQTDDWKMAQQAGVYKVRSLEEDGFIHLSYAHQVNIIADMVYKDAKDLLLLTIDPSKLTEEVKNEAGDFIQDTFPHLYGALNLDAVVQVEPYAPTENGTYPLVSE